MGGEWGLVVVITYLGMAFMFTPIVSLGDGYLPWLACSQLVTS